MNAAARVTQCLPGLRLRIWHLAAAVAAVAVAGALVHDGRMFDPALIAIAVSGFLGWCLIAAIGLGRLGRLFERFDRIADRANRRWLKLSAAMLYLLAALSLFGLGLVILLAIQLRFFPHAL